jgi:hypothetical protein
LTQDKHNSNKEFDMANHRTDSLFTEWPTPADTVRGFGGNPEKARHKQWQKDNNR